MIYGMLTATLYTYTATSGGSGPLAAAVRLVGVAYIVFILGCPFLGDGNT
jgi:hypothetical protein